jgi:hypothetical protein
LIQNQIEEIKGYKLRVMASMNTNNQNLRKLARIIITDQEFESILVWKNSNKRILNQIKTHKVTNEKQKQARKNFE